MGRGLGSYRLPLTPRESFTIENHLNLQVSSSDNMNAILPFHKGTQWEQSPFLIHVLLHLGNEAFVAVKNSQVIKASEVLNGCTISNRPAYINQINVHKIWTTMPSSNLKFM